MGGGKGSLSREDERDEKKRDDREKKKMMDTTPRWAIY
jgi:hypothetical protein